MADCSPGELSGGRLAAIRAIWSAGWIGIAARKEGRQALLGVIDQGVAALCGALPVIVLGRLGGEHELGIYSLAASGALFLIIASQSLFLSAYPVFRAHDPESSPQQTFYVVALGAATPALLAPLLLIGWFAFAPFAFDGLALLTLVIFVTTSVLRSYLRTISLARQDLLEILSLDALAALLLTGLLACLVMRGGVSAGNVFLALSLTNAAFAAVWLRRYSQAMRACFAGGFIYLSRSIRFGGWAFAGVTCGSASYYLTPWILTFTQGTSETAVYAAASTLVGFVNHALLGLLRGIEARTAESFHRGGALALREALKRTHWIVLPALIAIVVMVFSAADFLGSQILPDRGTEVGSVVRVLSLALLIGSVRVISGNGLWAMSLPQATLPADLLRGLAGVGLGIAGAHYAGALGCALGVLAGDAISTFLVVSRFRAASVSRGAR